MVKLRDGYQLFLQRFKIQKEDLIRFGIEETISIEEEVARIEWSRIKDILNGKEKRQYISVEQGGILARQFYI